MASRLVDQGVVVTISAGNSGDDGPFFASSGSSGKNVIAVASTDASVIAAPPFKAVFVLDGTANASTWHMSQQTIFGPSLDCRSSRSLWIPPSLTMLVRRCRTRHRTSRAESP